MLRDSTAYKKKYAVISYKILIQESYYSVFCISRIRNEQPMYL